MDPNAWTRNLRPPSASAAAADAGRPRRIHAAEWKRHDAKIRELYKTKTLDEVMVIMRREHNFAPSKRQYVYFLGRESGSRKYGPSIKEGSSGDAAVKSESGPKPNAYIPLFHRTAHLRLAAEAKDTDLSTLLSQYIVECVRSGSFFVDVDLQPRQHVAKGQRLFEFATRILEQVDKLELQRNSPANCAAILGAKMDTLDSLIRDEHPQLLGTLFSIRAQTNRLPGVDATLLSIISSKFYNVLGPDHLLSKIFFQLWRNPTKYDPVECMDRLAFLPGVVFQDRNLVDSWLKNLQPSFERVDDHSDSGINMDAASTLNSFPASAVAHITLTPKPGSSRQPSTRSTRAPTERNLEVTIEDPSSPGRDVKDQSRHRREQSLPIRSRPQSARTSAEHTSPPPDKTDLILEFIRTSSVTVLPEVGGKGKGKEREVVEPEEAPPSGSEDETEETEETVRSEQELSLTDKRRQIVDNVMQHFLEDLDNWVDAIVRQHGSTDGSGAGPRTVSSPETSNHESTTSRRKRKADRGSGRSSRKDNDENDDDQPPNKTPCYRDDENNPLMLACPYYKYNPRKYRHHRTCAGPGWQTVHRVKEHLYRNHRGPRHQCGRCYRSFDGERQLGDHLRQTDRCELREPVAHDGFNQEQEDRLKSRSKNLPMRQQWERVYKILFDVRDEDLPTPYYDYDLALLEREETFTEYVRREIIPLVRREIEAEVERRVESIEPGTREVLLDIIRNVDEPLRRAYEALHQPEGSHAARLLGQHHQPPAREGSRLETPSLLSSPSAPPSGHEMSPPDQISVGTNPFPAFAEPAVPLPWPDMFSSFDAAEGAGSWHLMPEAAAGFDLGVGDLGRGGEPRVMGPLGAAGHGWEGVGSGGYVRGGGPPVTGGPHMSHVSHVSPEGGVGWELGMDPRWSLRGPQGAHHGAREA